MKKISAFAFGLVLSFSMNATVIAESASTNGPWTPIAKDVCQQINLSVKYYQQGDVNKSHLTAVMAYFKHYDANLEPAVRTIFGNQHVFSVENQFSQLPKLMVENPSKEQKQKVVDAAKALCDIVQSDAQELNKEKVATKLYQTGTQ